MAEAANGDEIKVEFTAQIAPNAENLADALYAALQKMQNINIMKYILWFTVPSTRTCRRREISRMIYPYDMILCIILIHVLYDMV